MEQRKMQAAYIAGQITGRSGYRAKFADADFRLEKLGYIRLNPAELPEGLTKAEYMRICFAMIDTADIVFFLKGYEKSEGATLELAYCRYIGKPVSFLGV